MAGTVCLLKFSLPTLVYMRVRVFEFVSLQVTIAVVSVIMSIPYAWLAATVIQSPGLTCRNLTTCDVLSPSTAVLLATATVLWFWGLAIVSIGPAWVPLTGQVWC